MNQKEIGRFIYNLRVGKHLTQQQLADLIPITRQAVSRWEQGKSTPDSQTLIILSEIFDVTINELLSGQKKQIEEKEENKELEKLALNILDENNKNERKIRKYILLFSIIIIVMLTSFLFYYFFATYDSVKIFTVYGNSENSTISDGLFIATKQKNYFKLSNIETKNNLKIDNVKFYYKNNDKLIEIMNGKLKEILIADFYGYEKFFSFQKFNKIKNNFFIELKYSNKKTETINLKFDLDMSNDKFYYLGRTKNHKDDEIFKKYSSNELMKKVKEKVIKEGKKEQDVYILIINNQFSISYFENLNNLYFDIINKNTKELETYRYYFKDAKKDRFYYKKQKEKKFIKVTNFTNLNTCENNEKKVCEKLKLYLKKYIFYESN